MASQIFLDPTVTSASVIKVGGVCYQQAGPSSAEPDTFSIDGEFSDCTTCNATPCECPDGTADSYTVSFHLKQTQYGTGVILYDADVSVVVVRGLETDGFCFAVWPCCWAPAADDMSPGTPANPINNFFVWILALQNYYHPCYWRLQWGSEFRAPDEGAKLGTNPAGTYSTPPPQADGATVINTITHVRIA